VRELQLLLQAQTIAFADAIGGRAPFTHAVQSQDRRRVKRAGKKGAGGVAFVMVGKDQFCLARRGKPLLERPAHVQFVLEPKRHGQAKTAKARGAKAR